MAGKIVKIIIDAILSLLFFLVAAILINWVAGKIFGTTVGSDGSEVVNFNGGVLLAITTVLTIAFAVWFYKFVTLKKNKE